MQKRILALLMAALLMITGLACGETAAQNVQDAQPAEAKQPAPSEAGADAVAQNAFSGEEYFLEPEAGCNQLTIYWTAEHINFDTSDMWIWYEGKDGRGYPMYPCAYGAKCMINVPEGEKTVGFIVRVNCSEPCGTAWGSATKDYDGDRFAEITGKETAIYLKSGDGAI